MLKSMRNGFGLLPLIFVFASESLAQIEESPPSFSVSNARPTQGLSIEVGSGYARFNDLRIPEDQGIVLSDGENAQANETRSYGGAPISLGFAYLKRKDRLANRAEFQYLTVSNATDTQGENAENAKFTRFLLADTARYDLFKKGVTTPYLLGGGGARRNTYSNMSKAHFLDIVTGHVGLGFQFSANTNLEAFYGHSLYSSFGYSQGKNFKSEPVKGSKSTWSNYGVNLQYYLSSGASLNVGAESETAEIQITDLREYRAFGLNVAENQTSSRNYSLNTTTINLGLRKLL